MRLRNARDVGALVKDRRRKKNLSQQALADKAGVSRRWLAALESGKSGAELGMVLRVFSALDVDLNSVDKGTTRRPRGADGRLLTTSAPGVVDLDALLDDYGMASG